MDLIIEESFTQEEKKINFENLPKDLVKLLKKLKTIDIKNLKWINYRERGFKEEHIPYLIDVFNSCDLTLEQKRNVPESYLWTHIYRILFQLKSLDGLDTVLESMQEKVYNLPNITNIFYLSIDFNFIENFFNVEAYDILKKHFLRSFNYLKIRSEFFDNDSNLIIFVAERLDSILVSLANKNKESKKDCCEFIFELLQNYQEQHLALNTILVNMLFSLKHLEAFDLIKEVIEKKYVEEVITLQDVVKNFSTCKKFYKSPEIQKLFELKELDSEKIESYGFTEQHIPELLQILKNSEEFFDNELDDINDLVINILAYLKSPESLDLLFSKFIENAEFYNFVLREYWEWRDIVYAIGKEALPILQKYLKIVAEKFIEDDEEYNQHYILMDLLELIEKLFETENLLIEEEKNTVIQFLVEQLKNYKNQNYILNTMITSFLVDHTKAQYIDLIREVYKEKDADGEPMYVDETWSGPLVEIERKLGLLDEADKRYKEESARYHQKWKDLSNNLKNMGENYYKKNYDENSQSCSNNQNYEEKNKRKKSIDKHKKASKKKNRKKK